MIHHSVFTLLRTSIFVNKVSAKPVVSFHTAYIDMSSPHLPHTHTVENLPPVPLYGMVLISAGTALAIIMAVAILIIVVRHIYTVRKDKRQYRVDSGVLSVY